MTTCFVVQGFGKKTDFTDGRVLDLDASYAIIKEAVEASNLECIRADEIPHSGTIDVPMYKLLLQADLVIADLSTYNVNAAFELGVRYGLRPSATIIVAEEGFKNPFDVGHIVIRRYKHLGEDIGVKEARRFRDDLTQAITDILAAGAIDSPVYTFLPDLTPPTVELAGSEIPPSAPPSVSPIASPAVPPLASPLAAAPAPGAIARGGANLRFDETMAGTTIFGFGQNSAGGDETLPQTAKANLEQAQAKLLAGDFADASRLLKEVRKQRPNDSFVIQQLALSTYKSKQPTPEDALNEARNILLALNPETTNDPETLGLWGAIHKRLWEISHLDADLGKSIDAYGRGFQLKQDYYNGINLAFLLELRALTALKAGEQEEGLTDSVLAKRIRREVIKYTAPLITKDYDYGDDKRYWILATLWEAEAGLGNTTAAESWAAQARALKPASWMIDSTQAQIQSMLTMQTEIARLLGH
jgi:hypothetical protein